MILRWGVIGRGQGGCLTPPSPPTQLSWKLSSTLLPIAPSPFSNKKDFSLSGESRLEDYPKRGNSARS